MRVRTRRCGAGSCVYHCMYPDIVNSNRWLRTLLERVSGKTLRGELLTLCTFPILRKNPSLTWNPPIASISAQKTGDDTSGVGWLENVGSKEGRGFFGIGSGLDNGKSMN